jgi:hypothetical protein
MLLLLLLLSLPQPRDTRSTAAAEVLVVAAAGELAVGGGRAGLLVLLAAAGPPHRRWPVHVDPRQERHLDVVARHHRCPPPTFVRSMHETETLRLQHACTHDVDIVRPSILIGGGRGGEEADAAIPAAQLLQRRGGTTARRRLVGCTTGDTEAEPKPEAHRRHHAPRPYLAVGSVLTNPSTARTISPSTTTAMKNPKKGSGEPEPEKRVRVRSHARSMRRSLEEPEMDAEGQCLLVEVYPHPITEGDARVVEDERRSMYSAERDAEGGARPGQRGKAEVGLVDGGRQAGSRGAGRCRRGRRVAEQHRHHRSAHRRPPSLKKRREKRRRKRKKKMCI